MAITDGTYASLQTAITEWLDRSDLSGETADMIHLAEARLNRRLPAVVVDQTLTATIDNREMDISSYAVKRIRGLHIVDPTTSDERRVLPKRNSEMRRWDTSGRPRYYSVNGTKTNALATIELDRPPEQAYTFRMTYDQRYDLAANSTNWLLTNHYDVYLAASIVWGKVYAGEIDLGTWKALLEEGLEEVEDEINAMNRTVLTPPDAIAQIGRRSYMQHVNDI